MLIASNVSQITRTLTELISGPSNYSDTDELKNDVLKYKTSQIFNTFELNKYLFVYQQKDYIENILKEMREFQQTTIHGVVSMYLKFQFTMLRKRIVENWISKLGIRWIIL